MIVFLRRWGKDRKNTWSGTPMGIYKSLEQICGAEQIASIDINYGVFVQVIHKMWRLIAKVGSINDCELLENTTADRMVNRVLGAYDHVPVLMFTDYLSNRVADCYIYIDCSVDYVYRCQIKNVPFLKFLPLQTNRKRTLIKKRLNRTMLFYQECKGVFTMSKWLADDLVTNTGLPVEKVHCVGGGCNIPIKNIDVSQKQGNKILFVGKDFKRKGGYDVVKAFKLLNEQNNNKYELYIAGPEKWPFEDRIPSAVHFLGMQNMEQLSMYYNLCDIFVMPSLFEAYGIVFAEALIYGLPCIARDAFAMKEFIHDGVNGLLVSHDDPQELADRMYQLLSDSTIRDYVKEHHKEYCELYSWSSVASRILEVMRYDNYNV